MKRITKKILSVMLALVVVLGSVPFSVLSEISWFPFKITAFADDDSAGYPDYSELSENQYIARILLNYNYYGSATLGDVTSGTVPNEQLKYWINPNDVSAARILRNELAGNSGFMASVGAWEVLTFDPSKTADEIFDEEDYYTAILTSILDVKMKDSEFKKAWNCSTNKTILDMSKSVTKFAKEILGTDISKAESVSISDFSPEQMDKLLNEIGELKSSQSFYDATGKNISVIKDATKACNTLYDLIKTISTYSQIANLNKATETVLKEIYDNAPQGTPMKAAAKKVYEICSEQMTQAMFAQIETGEALFNIGFEVVVGKLWDVALKGIFNMFGVDCGLLIGIKIGQAVGKTIANYCFSTDKTIEQYYVLDAVVQFEDVMVNTVNSLALKFKQSESVESADALVKAVELLFETYDLGCEYTFSFVETANSSGLVNKVRSWFKKDETVETYKRLTDSMKNTINNVKTTLTSLEGYKWYYEVDAPAAYKKCFEPEDSNPAYSKSKEITYINISATESGGAIFDFNVNEGKTVTITNCNISASGEVSVPSEIGGCKVESIASSAFSNCKSMTTLKIGKNVKSIGNSAFYGCTGLTSIEIPSSVTYIDRYAFEGCTGLTSIEIPSSVTKIDDDAFSGCKNLSNVKLNRGLKSMGDGAFYGTAITSIKIPNTVTGMSEYNGKSVFSGATKLKSVEFEYGMLSIPSCALENCSDVTNVVIPNGVTNIDSDAFYGCRGLTSIEIPDSVTSIGNSAFYGCTGLTSIEIPDSVTNIGSDAFYGCTALKTLNVVENSSAHKWAVKNGYSVSFIDCSHYYKDVVVESVSGCTTRGYSYDICKTCGKKLQEYTVPEKGHSFTEATVITVPTCTAKGLKQSVCTKCGEKINTVLPLLEHQPERFGALKAPTCTEEGLQYGEKCSVCGEILKVQTVKPALGHRYGYDGICAVCGVDNAFEAESKHPYEASLDETKEIRRNGAVKVSVTFSEETKTEENCDYIYIYDKSNNLVGKYSGTQLSGKTVTVNGDTMKIRLVSDSDVNFFGYSIKKAEGIYGALIPAKDVLFDFDCNIIFTKQENVNTLDRLVTLNKSDEANSVTSIKSNNGSVFGSGSVICAFYDGVLDGVYTVALSGDLNGDGVCDVLDAMLCEKAANGHTELKTYQKYAANGGSADGVDISSYQRTVNEALK